MREIKFRGQDKANKKWLYGNLEIPLAGRSHSRHYILGYSYGQYQKHEVEPKTVGQFTGLKDMNGKEIFEGDIVEAVGKYPGAVIFENGTFRFEGGSESIVEDWEYYSDFKVIGNIYENPELLK